MKIFSRILLFSTFVYAFAACAESDSDNYNERYHQKFDTWMKVNIVENADYPGVVEKLEDGLWIEWLNQVPRNSQTQYLINGDWIEINYDGITMSGFNPITQQGNIFMTRSEEIAKRVGSYTVYTHYVPHYLPFNDQNNIMPGQLKALELMTEGDKVRLFLSGEMSENLYGLTYNYGHSGSHSTPTGYPCIIDMELVKITNDPMTRESREVVKYAMEEWGMEQFDTIRRNLYYQLLEQGDPADTITADTTAKLYYVGKFLDGFVFDTNIDSIGSSLGRDTSNYSVYSYRATSGGLIDAFYQVFSTDTLRFGTSFRMVFTSTYGYGSSGSSASSSTSTIIQPYTPLIFEVFISEREVDESEETDESE